MAQLERRHAQEPGQRDEAARLGDVGADFLTLEGGPVPVSFQRIDGYQGPGWPSDGKHVHLEFAVPDVEAAAKELAGLGATVPDVQPGGDDWTVLVDPGGHPFCLMTAGQRAEKNARMSVTSRSGAWRAA
ncbi:VOC family protein [Nonomuraea sp. NPDC049709]|uniref:VOC family protein n=1 Tax=Nonomuraea sp. NPDC049709 TaxID=3154736 RepID=UPI003420DB8D